MLAIIVAKDFQASSPSIPLAALNTSANIPSILPRTTTGAISLVGSSIVDKAIRDAVIVAIFAATPTKALTVPDTSSTPLKANESAAKTRPKAIAGGSNLSNGTTLSIRSEPTIERRPIPRPAKAPKLPKCPMRARAAPIAITTTDIAPTPLTSVSTSIAPICFIGSIRR